jgi:hypothetical protein
MLDQTGDMHIDKAVVVAVEVIYADQIGNAIPRFVFQQQAAQHRLLGFYGMRGKFKEL